MAKFMIKFIYSSGSWARMIKVADDRSSAVRTLVESLGGSLEVIYWDVQSSAAYALVDLPDAVAAVAVITATSKTGAFLGVEAHELLTERQIHEALTLAKDASIVYDAPGSAATEPSLRLATVGAQEPWPDDATVTRWANGDGSG
ncbi:MAG TPA: GYD domain-containing protein [Streptosporangiaceae bacterium]|nr:GYD domain-containing protein [Streptosporangiaceae bacterium]